MRPSMGTLAKRPRDFLWRLPSWANVRFSELAIRIEDLESDSDEAYAIRDEIRSLPGFPLSASERDFIRREITTLMG